MKTSRSLASLTAIAALTVALSACGSPATSPDPSSSPATEGSSTITVENAKPTLKLVEDGGEKYNQEDLEIKRQSVDVPFQPKAVVTFDIATLDTLDAIGAGDAVVGIPDVALPEYLTKYAELPKVGTLFEPDLEAVAALNPDLIVTAARSTGQYDALAEITTTIDLTGAFAGTFDPAKGLVRAEQLGEIFGAEDAVKKRIAAIEKVTKEIKDAVSGTALVLSVSGGEYGAFGEGSRFGYFFDGLGFTPAVSAAELPGAEGSPHGDSVTNEFILKANPDWIIAFDRGAAVGEASSAKETLSNELVGKTTAAKEGHIVYLPASELYIVINGVTAIENVLTTVRDAVTG